MRKSCRSISRVMFGCLFLLATVAVAQEQPGNPDYNWLNGKWRGPALAGGTLEMELRVVNDNEVKGSGAIRVGPKGTVKPLITGVVQGDKVNLVTSYPGGREYKYRFTYTDGKLRLKRKDDEVDYDKVE